MSLHKPAPRRRHHRGARSLWRRPGMQYSGTFSSFEIICDERKKPLASETISD